MTKGLEIPIDVADNITIASLTEHLNYLEAAQTKFNALIERNGKLEKYQEDDWLLNNKMIYHITAVLKYYGA